MKYLFTFCLCLACSINMNAQSVSLFDVDDSNFPIMKAKFYAFDAAGKQRRPSASELILNENGQPMHITKVNCQPPQPQKALSSVLVIDVSGSMSYRYGGLMNIDIAKSAATSWVNGLPLGASECAITSFDGVNYLNQDFTTNRAKLLNAIAPLAAQGGTDYDAALTKPMAGGLLISKNGKFQKVIVLITDGQGNGNESSIVAEASIQNCIIYCVTIGLPAPDILKNIASKTGGQVFENVTSVHEAEEVYRKILHIAQGGVPCEISWTSGVSCPTSERKVELKWNSITAQSFYSGPNSAIAILQVIPSFITFGGKQPQTLTDTAITLTAQNADFTITGIVRMFGSSDFNVVNTNFPITIPQNTTKTITLRFVPNDSSKKFTSFEILSDKCQAYMSASGGFIGKKITTPTLKLTKPNGGEEFVVGSDTLIKWDGIAKSDTVELEYSIDNGATWKSLTTSGNNLEYVWKNIPKPTSKQCKIRVSQNSSGVSSGNLDTLQFDLRGHTSQVYAVQWSPDGTKVVTASRDNTAIIWSTTSGTNLFTLSGHSSYVFGVQWSPDGTKVATASADGTAIIWSATSGTKLFTLSGHTASVHDVQWSPDGTKVATVSYDNTAIIWSATSGTKLVTLSGHTRFVHSVQWSPDGTKVATASEDFKAIIWSANSGTSLFTLTGHTFEVYAVQWSPDGTKVATVSADGTAIIWSATNGIKLFVLSGHTSRVTSVHWSPDGTKVATASDDYTTIIWSAVSGTNLFILRGHTNNVLAVQWSSDGTKIATAGQDKTAIIWSATSGTKLLTLNGHSNNVRAVQWSPDGTKVATASDDNTVKIWYVYDANNILQVDVSDAVFSIVEPSPMSQDLDMKQVLIGSVRDSLVSTFVLNGGSYPFRVDSIQVIGTDASQFSLVSGIPPFMVPALGTRAVEFRFRPASVGVKNAQLLVYTQADTLRHTIRGEGITPLLRVIDDVLDFGVVEVGKYKDTFRVLTITNSGNASLEITSTRHAGPNDVDFSTLAGGGNFTLAQGDTAKFDLKFSPKSIGRTSGRLLFNYNGAGSPATVQLYGEGTFRSTDTARTTIMAQDITAQAGEKVNLTLKLLQSTGMEIVGAPTEWYARIHYNKTILYNKQTDNQCFGTTDSCILELSGVYDPKTDVLITIPCITTLGNTDHSTIVIDTFLWMNSAILTDVATQNGTITITGTCEDGGVRLFIPAKNSTSLATRPNPAQDKLQIQYGLREPLTVTLELLTLTGQVVQTIVNNQSQAMGQYTLTSDLSVLGNGVYLLRLRTNKEMLTTRVDVVK